MEDYMGKKKARPTPPAGAGRPRHHPGDGCTQPPADFTEAQRALWRAAHRESQPLSDELIDEWGDQMH